MSEKLSTFILAIPVELKHSVRANGVMSQLNSEWSSEKLSPLLVLRQIINKIYAKISHDYRKK